MVQRAPFTPHGTEPCRGVFICNGREKHMMDIRENLAQIGEELKKELDRTSSLQPLEALRVKK